MSELDKKPATISKFEYHNAYSNVVNIYQGFQNEVYLFIFEKGFLSHIVERMKVEIEFVSLYLLAKVCLKQT